MIDKNLLLSNINSKNKINNSQTIKKEKISYNLNTRNGSSTPKLPTIKKFFSEISKTPIKDQNETNNTSNSIQKKKFNKIPDSFFNSLNNKDYNSLIHIKLKKLDFSSMIKSPSAKSIIPKKMPNIREFHNKIMSSNKLSYEKTLNEEYQKYEQQTNKLDIEEMLLEMNDKNKKIKTGIYGPNDNIVSVIRAKMERLKYDNEYRGVEPELKELIKDEIMDAQVKLRRKPDELNKKKFQIRPLYLRKLDQYRYLSKMNNVREINQMSNTPVIVKDGQVMLKLINDAFDNFKINNQ